MSARYIETKHVVEAGIAQVITAFRSMYGSALLKRATGIAHPVTVALP